MFNSCHRQDAGTVNDRLKKTASSLEMTNRLFVVCMCTVSFELLWSSSIEGPLPTKGTQLRADQPQNACNKSVFNKTALVEADRATAARQPARSSDHLRILNCGADRQS